LRRKERKKEDEKEKVEKGIGEVKQGRRMTRKI
jgi:hypothetical protein